MLKFGFLRTLDKIINKQHKIILLDKIKNNSWFKEYLT